MSLSNSVFSTVFVFPCKTYDKLGQFDYGGEENTKDLKEYIGTNTDGKKMIYIGQFKNGTEKFEGIGIWVCENGYTLNN